MFGKRFGFKIIFVFVVGLSILSSVFAQENTNTANAAMPAAETAPDIDPASVPKENTAPVPVVYPWTGELFAGYTATSGNTDNASAKFTMNLVKKYNKAKLEIKGNMSYSETDKSMDGQKWDGLIKYSHDFGVEDRWFTFAQVLVDHDYFSDVYYRVTPAAGLGYHIVRSEDFTWDVDGGLGYRITRHRVNTAADDESLTAILHTFLKKTVFEKAFVSEDITVYPGLQVDSGITLRSESVFSNPLSAKWDLELKYIVDYNSQPAAGMTTTDKQFVAGLKYKF